MADDSSINVKITATTEDLTAGLSKATGDVKSFGDEINNLAQRMAAVKPEAFKQLAQEFNAGKTDLDGFRDGLMAISTSSTAASTSVATLAQSSHISSMGMRELVVVGRELASGNLTRLPGSLSILATRLGGISPAAILGAAGIAAFAYGLYEVIDRSQQFEKELTGIQLEMEASGRGSSYSADFTTQLINNFRQATDVTRDQAAQMTQAFESVRTLGQADIQTISEALVRYKSVVNETSEEAAKDLEKAFGGDTIGYIDRLSEKFGVYTPAQLEAAKAAQEMGDKATLSKIALAGFLEVASKASGENATGLSKYFHDIGESLDGVSIKALHARNALLAAAEAAQKQGDNDAAAKFRYQASNYDSRTRNLPAYSPGVSGASAGADIDKSAQAQADAKAQAVTDSLKKTDEEARKLNIPLVESEDHLTKMKAYTDQYNIAVAAGNQRAAQEAQQLKQVEDQRYQAYLKSQEKKSDGSQDKLAEAEARAAAEGGDAQIKEKEEVVNEQMRLGQISTADGVKQLESLAAQEHEINLRRIADMRAVYAKQGDKAGVATTGGDEAKEDARYAEEKDKLNAEVAESNRKADEARIESYAKSIEAEIKSDEDAAKERIELGQSTASEELATLTSLVNQENQIERSKFDQLAALYQNDVAKFVEYQGQKQAAQQQANDRIGKLNTDAAKQEQQLAQQQQQQFDQAAQKIVGPWENALTQMSNGTKTWQQTVISAARQTESQFVGTLVRNIVQSWVLGETTKTAATMAGNSIRTASDTAAASTSASAAGSTNKETILDDAYTAAANVYANVSAIPYVGWVLAPAAAAVAFAAVAGFGMNLNSAAGGMVVDGDQLAMVHHNEMVLPARYTGGLTKMIDNANAGGGSGGANHFHFSPQINGRLGPDDIDGLHSAFGDFINKGLRNGQFGGMRRA